MAEIILAEGTAPATPAANKVTLYAKTDSLLYFKDDAGVEHPLEPNQAYVLKRVALRA